MTASTINVLRVRERTTEIRQPSAARDRVHFPTRFNPIVKAIAMLELASAPATPAAAPTADDHDGDFAAPGKRFAGLLAPAGRRALADEIAEALEVDGPHEVARNMFTTERGLAANVIAKRLVAARELNGFSQNELAKALGYKNSAQLSQWEQCKRPPPLHMLIATADALAVSVDYLLGRCDDPERDLRAVRRYSAIRAVRSILTAAAERVADAFDTDERVVGAGTADIRALLHAVEACVARSGRLRSGHGGKEEVLDAIDRLEGAALKVGIALRRHDDEDARQRERLALIAANDASGAG
ncbi:helix-turn-helix protein [Variovorax sp. SRS16]|uniref:helix-turn-helix domain-containing protein n=1 Tax=Variovorax sp. SRS16 TaxID=282217 RepID=UPI0013197C80|nr:helix-turn-helix transcriptional regulator [Variovorax sp. SRS16]VTU25064.1 helix-turn-helix protein [Variovorax sp. SRS16]